MTLEEIKSLTPGVKIIAGEKCRYRITKPGTVCEFVGFVPANFLLIGPAYSNYSDYISNYPRRKIPFLEVIHENVKYTVLATDFYIFEEAKEPSEDEVLSILSEIISREG
jgi:hypothetical protein